MRMLPATTARLVEAFDQLVAEFETYDQAFVGSHGRPMNMEQLLILKYYADRFAESLNYEITAAVCLRPKKEPEPCP